VNDHIIVPYDYPGYFEKFIGMPSYFYHFGNDCLIELIKISFDNLIPFSMCQNAPACTEIQAFLGFWIAGHSYLVQVLSFMLTLTI